MPYKLTVRSKVLCARWRGFTVDELNAVAMRVADLRRAVEGRVVYLSHIPGGGPAFSDADYTAFFDFLRAILPACSTVHHVLEGSGFTRSARVATVTNLAIATGRARDFHVHDSMAAACSAIALRYGIDLTGLADPRGVATPATPDARRASVAPVGRASGAFRLAIRIAARRGKPPAKV